MLEVQKYLKNNSLEELVTEYGLKHKWNKEESLVILDYHQIDSQKHKYHPIVRECRGLTLNNKYELVAKSFSRFYNFGEATTEEFDWNEFTVYEKLDGSLVLLYFYNGEWRFNTRLSFGDARFADTGKTWDQVIKEVFESKYDYSNLEQNITYTFEFVHPKNQIVKYYDEPNLYLLAAFDNTQDGKEVGLDYNEISHYNIVPIYKIKDKDELFRFLLENEKKDSTWEGFVVKDRNGLRLKIKTESYKREHRLWSNQLGIEDYIEYWFENRLGEIVDRKPYFKEEIQHVTKILEDTRQDLSKLYEEVKHIEDRKEYAKAICGRHKLYPILMECWKHKTSFQEQFLLSGEYLGKFVKEKLKIKSKK